MTDWTDTTQSNTTTRNSSRFIVAGPYDSSIFSGGVDFTVRLDSVAPAYFDSIAPVYLSVDTRF